jgi:ADP-ribose pyrophosphatase
MKKLLETKLLLETPIFKVTDNYLIDPAGKEIRRILVEHGGSTVAMPVDERKRVLMVRQYRFPVRKYLWELPAGKIDAGETALKGAKRELQEETGYRARRWTKLITFYPSPGFQQEKMTVFLAEELTAGKAHVIEDEDLEVEWFPLKQVEQDIAGGKIIDAKTIIGVQMYRALARARK